MGVFQDETANKNKLRHSGNEERVVWSTCRLDRTVNWMRAPFGDPASAGKTALVSNKSRHSRSEERSVWNPCRLDRTVKWIRVSWVIRLQGKGCSSKQ